MSLLKLGGIQIGQSNTASNNFHWRNLLDGLLRLSRGNAGSPITDVMRVKADNSVEFPGGIVGAFGQGQTWQDMTSSRAAATTYTNTTGRPIMVIIGASSAGDSRVSVQIGSLGEFSNQMVSAPGTDMASVSFIVPHGETYRLVSIVGTLIWMELR